MANYDFGALTVLLVEDNPFVCALLETSLKTLGVRNTVVKTHGGEAVAYLKLMQSNPVAAGFQTMDIVIANWDVAPIDGLALLNWIRQNADSPDKFLPFLMVCGQSYLRRVNEARDAGADDFLAKPFTVEAICEKITDIIENPRQFVQTKTFFGPDRRRRKLPYDGPERRALTDKSEGVEIVYV